MTTSYLLICLAVLFISANGSKENQIDLEGTQKFNDFDWNFTKAVGMHDASKNVILSPISLKLVLATLYEGAAGNSAKQLREALDLREAIGRSSASLSDILASLSKEHAGYDLNIGTKIFMDKGAKPLATFEKKISNLYNATIDQVDFQNTTATLNQINTWAKSVTRGHIEKLLSEADTEDSLVLLLLNAVYFKGVWENKFLTNETVTGKFELDSRSSVDVEYMTATHSVNYADSPDLNASIVRLPYVGGRFAMYIILPFVKHDLNKVMGNITPDKLRKTMKYMEPLTTKLILPKFKVEFASSLAPVLKKLGITDIFNANADLSGITENGKDLLVSNVIQKVGLEINEQGSIAYVATQADLANKFGEYIADFNASHPFIFFIEDETTHTVVFVGKISDPTSIGNPKVSAGASYPVVTTLGNVVPHQNLQNRMPSSETQHIFSYFDIELAQTLYNQGEGNTIVSPASIKTILGLILSGSGGRTRAEILHALRLSYNITTARAHLRKYHQELQHPSKTVTVKSGNRLLVRKDLKILDTYKSDVLNDFDVVVESVDFKHPEIIVKQVNTWVNKLTNSTIHEIVSPSSFSPTTSLAIVNAVYFKGDWSVRFDPKDNTVNCFFTEDQKCIKTEFMSTTGFFKMGIIGSLNALVLELSYSDPRYSMVFLIPRAGMKELMRDLPFNPLLPLLDVLPHSEVIVSIPKFTVEYSVKLNDVLTKLRAGDMFSSNSDLSKMFAENGKVTDVLHKAKIIVNEKGTIAGAASVAYVETLIASSTLKFVANNPFLYFIKDQELGFLFQGQYMFPTGDDVKVVKEPSSEKPSPTEARKPQRPEVQTLSKYEKDDGFVSRPSISHTTGNILSIRPAIVQKERIKILSKP